MLSMVLLSHHVLGEKDSIGHFRLGIAAGQSRLGITGRSFTYLTIKTYGPDGALTSPTDFLSYKTDKSDAAYRLNALSKCGFYQEDEILPKINMRSTIEAVVENIANEIFERSTLISSDS